MSKKHGHRKKRRKRLARSKAADARLRALADALNDIEASGRKIRFAHGIVFHDRGYVLQGGNGKWKVVTLPVHPDAPESGLEPDDD